MKKIIIAIGGLLIFASCTKKIEVPKKTPGVYIIVVNPDPVPPKHVQVK